MSDITSEVTREIKTGHPQPCPYCGGGIFEKGVRHSHPVNGQKLKRAWLKCKRCGKAKT